MWWVKTSAEGDDRGGFQDRDIGRRSLDENFGPDFGVDYARFSDPPNLVKDEQLRNEVVHRLERLKIDIQDRDVKARNGFVLISGKVNNDEDRRAILENLFLCQGVRDVISDLHVLSSRR